MANSLVMNENEMMDDRLKKVEWYQALLFKFY